MSIEILSQETRTYDASEEFVNMANFNDPTIYKKAQDNRLAFWEEQANNLHWFTKWESTLEWNRPFAKWFLNGKLNASYNCLDIHLNSSTATKTAIIWEGENGDTKHISYQELHKDVCQLANTLKKEFNVQKGDRVTLYMPMIPELAVAVLACARIGAIHSVIFGGFSASSIKDRVQDSESKLIITADGGYRRGKVIPLKEIVDKALEQNDTTIEDVLVLNYIGLENALSNPDRDSDYKKTVSKYDSYCLAEEMDSEDPLFILYTSGTTGKPKGILHTTGGYLTHAKYSTKAVFDLKDDDIYWCTADIGWITGHTYFVYGPLANGTTALMFEGTPDYPEKDRFWDVIAKHKVTILYTAPTAIRAFMKWGTEHTEKHDLTSLRLLGTVGEPINPEAWLWYHLLLIHGGKPKLAEL